MSTYKTSAKKLPKVKRCILLLWGDQFDDVAATVFTVMLRKAGLCVKVVGVDGLLATGCNGLVLHADLALSEITPLVDNMLCLVLPCDHAALTRYEADPRLHVLFAAALRRQAKFVLCDPSIIRNSSLNTLAIPSADIAAYAAVDNLMTLAKEVSITLSYLEKSFHRRTPAALQTSN